MATPPAAGPLTGLPGRALRAVFVRVGQLVMAADRLRETLTAGSAQPDQRRAEPAPATPPLANYQVMSLPALRARLRTLDRAQLRDLVAYERAHAARPEVVVMFERRIAKLDRLDGEHATGDQP